MKFYKIAQSETKEYMLENGMLYDEDGEDVFSMKELLKYNVPLFGNATIANNFLEKLEIKTKRTFGRVPDKNYMKDLRYKDTKKERQIADQEFLGERGKRWQKGDFNSKRPDEL